MTPTACWRAASSCIGGAGPVSAVAAANGVDLAFWWQPTLASRDPAEGEEFLLERAAHRHPAWYPLVEDVSATLPPEVLDLSDALDNVEGPVFWDTVHTNEVECAPHRRGRLSTFAASLATPP